MDCIASLERVLADGSLAHAVLDRARRTRSEAIEVLDFVPEHADAFRRLNEAWLTEYFEIEPVDVALLGDPVAHVIEPGGAILFASLHGEIVGTCALLREEAGVFELSKMGVAAPCQGLGIGRRLLAAAIERFHALGGRRLFLESSSKLAPALALYESVGFEHAPRPGGPSPYARADVYMVLHE